MFASVFSDWRRHASNWLLVALVTVFGLQELRVLFVGFVGYLRDSQGMSSLSLAPVALLVFALAFLAGPLNRIAGTRVSLWITAGGLALVRVLEQISASAPMDLYLSSAGAALFLMWIPLAIGIARSKGGEAPMHLGFAFLLGVSADSSIQIAGSTLDLSWQPGILSFLIVLALAALLVWSLLRESATVKQANDGSWLSNLALLAIGPWLFLQLLIFQNVAFLSSLTGWETPAAGALLVAGSAAGLYLAAQAAWPARSWVNVVLVGAFTLIPWLLIAQAPDLAYLWLFLAEVFSFALGMFIFLAASRVPGKRGLLSSTVMHGIGQIFFVLFVFIYYATYDIDFGFRSGILPPVALVLSTVLITFAFLPKVKTDKKKTFARTYTPAFSALLLLLIPLALHFSWKQVTFEAAPSGTDRVTVMDYNLHDAVNTDGRVDPEALARVIEESGADIVGLQEISRGWLTWGGMDMLTWLSQRLDMPYVWGPTADAQWGNAVLSRYPILGYATFDLPPTDVLLLRGFIVVQVDVDGKPLTLVDTHFSEREGQDGIRAQQAAMIIELWGNAASTVVMGDLNALPDSEAVARFLDAGFIDASREIGEQPTYTYYSADPDHQIDYIFVTPDLGYENFHIPRTTASDHLPLILTVILP